MKWLAAVLALMAGLTLAHATPQSATRTADMRDAVDRITIAAENSDYHLVKVQAIDTALVKRGYEDPGVRILFFGKASAMEEAEMAYPPLLSMLPIKLVLVVRGNEIVVMSDDLDAWKEMFPDPAAHRLIEMWRQDIAQILKDFAAQ